MVVTGQLQPDVRTAGERRKAVDEGFGMNLEAVIFDMDGTLVDTNATHVEAWRRAFERGGFSVRTERILPEVGKGGDMLVPAILGEPVEREHGETLRRYNGEEFLQLA